MRKNTTPFRIIGLIALLALVAGCVTVVEQERLLGASGFKVIAPNNSEQAAFLAALTPGKVIRFEYQKRTFFLTPAATGHLAYVGGPNQFLAYKQIRRIKHLGVRDLEGPPVSQADSMNWNSWSGWDGPGWYGSGW